MHSARRAHWATICLVVLLALDSTPRVAQAMGVSVAPQRIVLEGRTFAATVYLSNRGDTPATYRIGLARLAMKDTGEIVRVDEETPPGVLFADDLLRYSPRRCVVPPGGSQTVRLLVRRPRGNMVQTAEYRTHLAVRTVPEVPNLEEVEAAISTQDSSLTDDELSIRTVATLETLVPIIIRFGRLDAEPSIRSAWIEENENPEYKPVIHVALGREGDRSLYGTMEFTHIAPDGEESNLGFIRGLALYTPLPERSVRYPFEVPAGVDLSTGELRVDFVESEEGGGDGEATVTVPLAGRGSD